MDNVMDDLNDIDYEKLAKKNLKKKRETPYEDMTHYKTVKEFFLNSVEKYPKEDCILEKPDHKTPYKMYTYQDFKDDVFGLGTALVNVLNLKNKRVIIIGETQYGWYVSYMVMLCGVGIAVPTDRELPLNELENIVKRSICFLQGYGLTETAPISAVTPEYKPCVGSAGRTIVQADIKVDNPNENGEGELLIKSPTLMIGYYEDEEETKKAIDKDGYFHSGDIGYVDDDKYVFITGRSKNVIVTQNGKNIFPEEIEMLLDKTDEIKESMVYGKKPDAGSKKEAKELIITARVIPDYDKIKEIYGDNLSEKEIYDIIWKKVKEVNKQLTSYKAVKALEIKHGEFEKTSTMKIKRYKELQNDNK